MQCIFILIVVATGVWFKNTFLNTIKIIKIFLFIVYIYIWRHVPCINGIFFVFGMLLQKIPGIFFLANMQHVCFLFQSKNLPAYFLIQTMGAPPPPNLLLKQGINIGDNFKLHKIKVLGYTGVTISVCSEDSHRIWLGSHPPHFKGQSYGHMLIHVALPWH